MHVLNIVDIHLVEYFLQKSFLYLDVSYTFTNPKRHNIARALDNQKPDLLVLQYRYFNHDLNAILEQLRGSAFADLPVIILYFENDNSAFQEIRDSYEGENVLVVNKISLTSSLESLLKKIKEASPVPPDEIITILLANNSPLIRLYVEKILLKQRFTLLEAGDGEEAYTIFCDQKPDIVVADYKLDRLDGAGLCKKIKEKHQGSYLPVLLILDEEECSDENLFFESGVDEIIKKPLNSDRLIASIDNYFKFRSRPSFGTVLLAGEKSISRQMLYNRFVKENMAVVLAEDEVEILDYLSSDKPDFLIFEINSPVSRWEKLFLKIRKVQKRNLDNLIIILDTDLDKSDMKKKNQLVELLDINYQFYKPFHTRDITALVEGLMIEKFHIFREDFDNLLSSIKTLVVTNEAKNPFTMGHTEKVRALSLKIGTFIGLGPLELRELEIGATLHDIGKIGVRDDIISKPNKLTRDEFEKIQEHTVLGAQIIQPIITLKDIIPYILFHHERWDGKGYPSMIKENQIPVGVRILIIAESFIGMTSDRPYRKGMKPKAALDIIEENLGKQFCPSTGKAFLQMMKADEK